VREGTAKIEVGNVHNLKPFSIVARGQVEREIEMFFLFKENKNL
jgi:hypothetical protein